MTATRKTVEVNGEILHLGQRVYVQDGDKLEKATLFDIGELGVTCRVRLLGTTTFRKVRVSALKSARAS